MKKEMKLDTCVKKLGKKNTKLFLEALISDSSARLNQNTVEIGKINFKIEKLDNYIELKETPLNHKKPNLYIIIGLPRSGKSSYCNKYLSECDYISRDEIRENIFE